MPIRRMIKFTTYSSGDFRGMTRCDAELLARHAGPGGDLEPSEREGCRF